MSKIEHARTPAIRHDATRRGASRSDCLSACEYSACGVSSVSTIAAALTNGGWSVDAPWLSAVQLRERATTLPTVCETESKAARTMSHRRAERWTRCRSLLRVIDRACVRPSRLGVAPSSSAGLPRRHARAERFACRVITRIENAARPGARADGSSPPPTMRTIVAMHAPRSRSCPTRSSLARAARRVDVERADRYRSAVRSHLRRGSRRAVPTRGSRASEIVSPAVPLTVTAESSRRGASRARWHR